MIGTNMFWALSKSTDWETPQWVFEIWNAVYHFTLDACAEPHNTKCKLYFTLLENGLRQSWRGHRVWCNPPYLNIRPWVAKAYWSCLNHGVLVVMLLPARTDMDWFHDYIWKQPHVEIEYIKGRVQFEGGRSGATFASMIVIFDPAKVRKA